MTKSWHAHRNIRLDDMKEMSLFLLFIKQSIELSTEPFTNLLLWNRLKTAYVLLYVNRTELYKLNVCLGNLVLGGWGNRCAGAGGTGVLLVICLVFEILRKNPSR